MRRSVKSVLGTGIAGVVLVACAAITPAAAQVRVGQWNITNYGPTATRDPDFKAALYGVAPNGLQFAPDILVVQEIVETGAGGTIHAGLFLNVLNTAPGSPGDWAMAPYVQNGGDSGNAMYYRTSRFAWLGTATLSTDTGTGPDQAPRDTQRWQVRLAGYSGIPAQLYLYGGHFKAGSSGADQARRIPEGRRIRINANALPDNANFLLGADLNVQSSGQTFYEYMLDLDATPLPGEEFLANASGRFFDPINTPAAGAGDISWENNGTYRYIHTQDQASTMDSRHDQILIGPTLRDGQGMAYLPEAPGGDTAAAYSQSTWDDPNHSHRAWGNDGSSYDTVLTTGGNTMVGPAIAQALINSAAGGGHLPVFLDLQVPAKLAPTPATADFGTVALGAAAQATIQVGNSADVALWSRDGTGFGIDSLTYTLTASAGFTAPAGTFNEAPDGAAGGNSHVIVMNTSTAGTKTGTLTITSDDPDSPTRVIALTGVVGSGSSFDYDVNDDGLVNTEDLHRWYGLFTDVTGNGTVDAADVAALRAELRRLEIADITAGRR